MFMLVAALVFFYFTHSLLAATAVKQWAADLGLRRWYRLVYSAISLAQVAWVVLILQGLDHPPLFQPTAVATGTGILLLVAGVALSLAAVMRFGAAGFLGLVPEGQHGLVRTGMHGRVRHPIYSGIILACLGWALVSPVPGVLVAILITFLYLPLGIQLEERKLIAIHGDRYLRYRAEVPALLPSFRGH